MSNTELLLRIERAALWAWPPRRTAHLGGWLLRAGGAGTRRAASAQTLAFDDSLELDRAIDRVEAWYAERGRPACFQLTDAYRPPGLDDALIRRGYARSSPTSVMVAADPTVPEVADRTVEIVSRPTQAVANALADPYWTDRRRTARAALYGRIRRPHAFAVAWAGGEPAAGGLVVVDGDLAGLFALRTAKAQRRRGLARLVSHRLIGWAQRMGARTCYLQVEDANKAALALYRGLGFERVYGYWYREPGTDGP